MPIDKPAVLKLLLFCLNLMQFRGLLYVQYIIAYKSINFRQNSANIFQLNLYAGHQVPLLK
jgi:hypothetical protein